ncbi:MAG: hypothetical protein RMZ95_019460 [Nostoc sp. DedQUE07]
MTGRTQVKLSWGNVQQQKVPLANRKNICRVIMYILRPSNKYQEISKFKNANKLGGILHNYLAIASG